MDKFKVEVKGSEVVAGYDGNSDNENSVELKLNLKEALAEIIMKGEAKVGVKGLSIKRDGTKIILAADSDKDGEAVLSLAIDLGEAMDEAIS